MATLRLRNKDHLEEQYAPIDNSEHSERYFTMEEEVQMFKEEDLVYGDPNRAVYRGKKKDL